MVFKPRIKHNLNNVINERDSSICVRGINSPKAAIPRRLEHVILEVAGLAKQVPQMWPRCPSGGFPEKQIEPHMT